MFKLLPRNKTEVMGLEFNDSTAQFVQIAWKSGGYELLSYNRVELNKGLIVHGDIKDEQALKDRLVSFLEGANPSYVDMKNVVLLLPTRSTFAHVFRFPSSFTFKEVKKAVPFQAETLIPFPIDEVYWDIELLKHEEGSKEQSVLFVAVPKASADAYARVAEHLGLKPFVFSFYSDSLRSAVQASLKTGIQLVIDFGSISNNFLITQNAKLQFSFSSNKGAADVAKSKWEEYLKSSLKQGKKLLDDYFGKQAYELESIVLAGEYSVQAFEPITKEAGKIFPEVSVLVGDPKSNIKVEDERFKVREEDFKDQHLYSVGFTHPIGAALLGFEFEAEEHINLLPDGLKTAFFNKRWSIVLSIGISVLISLQLFLAGLGFYVQQNLLYEQSQLQAQKENVERSLFGTRYQEIQEELLNFNEEVAVLIGIDRALFSIEQTLSIVLENTPSSIQISEISFDDDELVLQLEGVAASREELLSYQENLKSLAFVEELSLPISNFDSKSNISFSMSLLLRFKDLPYYATPDSE